MNKTLEQVQRIGDGRIVINGETYVNEKSGRVMTAAKFDQQSHAVSGDMELLENIMTMFGDAHNLLAKTKLSKEDYQPISILLAKGKIDLFNYYKKLKSGYAAAPHKGMKEVDHEAEKEVMMQAFDKVYKIFQARTWVMEGRGSYRYDDDRYKEEVRYLFDEFDAIHKDTWKNIKSKSADFRLKVIEQYKKDLKNPYIRLSETGTLDESPSPSEAGDEIEIIDGYTQLAIDKRSLPKDGQHVKFMTENEEFHEGYFVGGDDIFHVTDSKFFFKWHVQQWKVI